MQAHSIALTPHWGFLMEKERPHEWDHPPKHEQTPLLILSLVLNALMTPTGEGAMSNSSFPTSTPVAVCC